MKWLRRHETAGVGSGALMNMKPSVPGQLEEIDRVHRAYPHLNDDDFVANHRDEWLR